MWGSTLLQDQITDNFSAKSLEDSFRDCYKYSKTWYLIETSLGYSTNYSFILVGPKLLMKLQPSLYMEYSNEWN